MSHGTPHEPHGDGLHEDLVKLASRCDAVRIFGSAGAAAILSTLGVANARAKTPTAEVPGETAGPYPGDGSNGPNGASFKTVFPACYDGRWPHIHFEVYASVAKAVSNGPIVKTSQIALPAAACRKVYATSRYAGSASNLARTSLSSDNVFADDKAIHQRATVTGSVKEGFVANLTVGSSLLVEKL